MPNSANRKAGDKEDVNKKADAPAPNPERSDNKHGGPERGRRDDTSRISSQGRGEASGGSAEE